MQLFVSLYLCQCVSVIEDSQKTGAISSELEVPVLQIIFGHPSNRLPLF